MQRLMNTHPVGTKNSYSALRHSIERLSLAGTATPGAQRVAVHNFSDLLELVARTVDETVLPRNYTLANGAGNIAMLTVANRRLFGLRFDGVLHADERSGQSDAGELAGNFVNQLRAICETTGPYEVYLHSRAENFSAVDASCSAASLRKASSAPQAENRLALFSLHIQSVAKAWLFNENTDRPSQHLGPADMQQILRAMEGEIVDQNNDRNLPLRTTLAKPSVTIFPFCSGMQVIIAKEKQNFIIAIISEAEVTGVTQVWKKLFSREA